VRLILDLQGAQSNSRFRGIGRYSLAFAQAIAREARQHEVWVALNGRIPNSVEPLRAAFADLVPPERIRIFELPMPVAEIDTTNAWRMRAAELLREKFLADLRPDIVHVSTIFEGLGDEVVSSIGRLDTTVPTAVTLYDLIPLLHPECYLAQSEAKRFYLRRLQSLKRADLLLAISESSRQEAIKALQILPERITAIGAGVEQWFQAVEPSHDTIAALMTRYGLQRPFVLYTGGDDPRKNMEGLVEAFALLPEKLREGYQLAIVCRLQEDSRRRLAAVASNFGLDPHTIVCLGYVPDEDLRLLYGACSLFVFPSLHEGFGLPILEAMVGGAPVIGSNCASIPEIIDREDALFDPREPRDIAKRLAAVLANSELRENLKSWGHQRAKTFTWEACARRALQAFESLHADRTSRLAMMPCRTSRRRPLLAFVAPLPSQRTGIADYSARLLPNLARYYEIICIVDQPEVTDVRITAEFAIRDIHWFENNAERFERILYQFGNSAFHKHMFRLLDQNPGVVVLHDFYLGGILNWMSVTGYAPEIFTEALYVSHGFSGLQKHQLNGREASKEAFPCNAAVLRGSIGTIVHSDHAIALAHSWYDGGIPVVMRSVPFLPMAPEVKDRPDARVRLGLPETAFVVCSFGFLAPTKLNDRLLESWLASPLAGDETCFLIFVGENYGGEYGKRLLERIAGSEAAFRIQITGYVQESQYREYLAAGDLAVQLRGASKGETSAAIFDCLSSGVPLVINAHGSAAELPDDAVMKLGEFFTDEALSAALKRLRADSDLRRALAARGVLHVNRVHHPERIAVRYRDVIEEVYGTSAQARERTLLHAIGRDLAPMDPTEADLVATATAIGANRDRFGARQILVDVSSVAQHDQQSETQRTIRALMMALVANPPAGYRIEPVRSIAEGYCYARRFACDNLGLKDASLVDEIVETGPGDLFLDLDWAIGTVPDLAPWFKAQRQRGLRLVFLVFDMFPLLRPEIFDLATKHISERWLEVLVEVADGLVCLSPTTAMDLLKYLERTHWQRLQPLQVGFFQAGADIHTGLAPTDHSQDTSAILAKLRSRPSFLMVARLAPRKGYHQALSAMEQLWANGVDANLVIIGVNDGIAEDLVHRLQRHPELDNRLFCLDKTSDEMLEQLYRNAGALLAASEGEGFSLSLIEAVRYGLPIIARDIPVFREVAGDHAYYFRGEDSQALADALGAWLSLGPAVPATIGMPWLTWQQSSQQLLDIVLGERWYRSWPDAPPIFER
jgi:glycosyltransferase involved in cell wall biosynthesis